MKKLLTVALACCIAVSALCLGVNAQGKNYLKSEWTNGLDATVSKEGDVYKAVNMINQWSSPFLPSLAAIKDAVSKEESIIVTFKIRAVYKAGNEGEYTTARVLFRGTTPEKIAQDQDEEWQAKYEESLDGEDALFRCRDGNVMYYGSAIEFTDSEWTLVEWPMALTSAQVDNKMITEWNLCIDTVKDNTLLAGIEIKDAGIYCESDYVSDAPATPTPTPTPEPEEDTTPTPTMKNVFGETTPTPTVGAEATATVEATEVPNDTKGGNSLWWVWVIVAVVVVAGGGAAVYFFVIKKKKDGKAE